ncbi:class I SAM-dependent methyltransferase [Gammaproteobacteria bacterium]|nr:class I SAM-dependent methyltransferase [Gammaproteobacteria bacterium]
MASIESSPKYANLIPKIEQLNLPDDMHIMLQDPHHILTYQKQSLYLDLNTQKQRLLKTSHPLLKACGEPTSVLDACAGLGKDGLILASAGFDVYSTEENLLLYLILEQAIKLLPSLNWQVQHQKAQVHFVEQNFDIIYLDPMFMTSTKSKPKKGMQFIQTIATKTSFEDWNQAYHAAKKRLVIKHDHKTPPIATLPKPTFEVSSAKKSRFDVYLKV